MQTRNGFMERCDLSRATLSAMDQQNRFEAFAHQLWEWFSRRKRSLPWRDVQVEDDTQRAYMILVSEVMLQQTQVSRVIIIFKQFLETFPTVKDLAGASNKEVVLAWKGMGYNSRALRLRDAAKTVVDQYGGRFPRELSELLAIKGIGAYTAGAIRNFAFGIPTPCVDTNIHRILHRVFDGPEPEKNDAKTQKKVLGFADQALKIALHVPSPQGRGLGRGAADWHAALMDFGSLTCKKSVPLCAECPMAGGICKSAFKVVRRAKVASKEPGRTVGAKFIPNRIFRGRVVDALREHHEGLTLTEIGLLIAPDWSAELETWLQGILEKLIREDMIARTENTYALPE
jgi:A/G-specific adenine glycosylase